MKKKIGRKVTTATLTDGRLLPSKQTATEGMSKHVKPHASRSTKHLHANVLNEESLQSAAREAFFNKLLSWRLAVDSMVKTLDLPAEKDPVPAASFYGAGYLASRTCAFPGAQEALDNGGPPSNLLNIPPLCFAEGVIALVTQPPCLRYLRKKQDVLAILKYFKPDFAH